MTSGTPSRSAMAATLAVTADWKQQIMATAPSLTSRSASVWPTSAEPVESAERYSKHAPAQHAARLVQFGNGHLDGVVHLDAVGGQAAG